MTEKRLMELQELKFQAEQGREYLDLAEKQENYRANITCLLGNAPHLITEKTLGQCWDMMRKDATAELDELQKEFDAA